MRFASRLIPTGSQTVGPFFRIGLDELVQSAPQDMAGETVRIHGTVLDGNGAAVPDAMLEFWSSAHAGDDAGQRCEFPIGFRRVATEADGSFSVEMAKVRAVPLDDGRMQAPHLLVLVFMRGLLRHLITRVYFAGEAANMTDPVLESIPLARRVTLIAQQKGDKAQSFEWNVVLQGTEETVFFAW
jgi:protocatechuate 3,4-dioxygenase alpha subunit